MQAAFCNLKIKSLFVSFLVFEAAVFIISVVFKHEIYWTADVMVLAQSFTTKLSQFSKRFFHGGIYMERAFQAKQLHWCIPGLKDSAFVIIPSQCAQAEGLVYIYI